MLRKLLAVVFFTACAALAFSQEKPRLAILPFTGAQGDEGETIAELFSYDEQLNEVFDRIPRTNISQAVSRERRFQMASGMTDPDTVVSISRELGARYVVAGNIASVGKNRLLVISIMDIFNLQQIAGDYLVYTGLEKIPGKLPDMAANIILATQNNTSALPKLAVLPVKLQDGADQRVADTLAQLLAINLIRSGKYAVYPRTGSLEQVTEEHQIQMKGHTGDAYVAGTGHGENPDLVLSVVARKLEKNRFNAEIINLLYGTGEGSGYSVEYQNINDGIKAMEKLSLYLTGTPEQISRLQKQDALSAFFADKARFWTVGISAGSSFAAPWVIGTLHATIAPFRKSFLEIGFDFGMISGVEDVGYYSMYPYAHYALFLPFSKKGGWYAGAGGGYMMSELDYPEGKVSKDTLGADFTTGFNIGNIIDISYTLRTNFKAAENKVSAGYTYRFSQGKN